MTKQRNPQGFAPVLIVSTAALILGFPRMVRAEFVQVQNTAPGGGSPSTTISDLFPILNPGTAFLAAPVPSPDLFATPYKTPDGNFSVAGTVAAGNLGFGVFLFFPAGFTVTDLTGVTGEVDVTLTQTYQYPHGFAFPVLYEEFLTATFKEASPRKPLGDSVSLVVNANATVVPGFPTLTVLDSGPATQTGFSFILTQVKDPILTFSFIFEPGSSPGDAIVLPGGFTVVTPEPSSLVLLASGILGLAGYAARRNPRTRSSR